MPMPSRSPVFQKILSILDKRVTEDSVKARVDSMDAIDLDIPKLKILIETLPANDSAGVLLSAIIRGDNLIAEMVWDERGPFPVDLKKLPLDETMKDRYTLNGEPFSLAGIKIIGSLRSASTRPDLVRLFRNIRDMKVKGLIGPSESERSLFEANPIDEALEVARSVSFGGELPVFTQERVERPELLLELLDASRSSIAGTAYDPLLCWANPEMVSRYSGQLYRIESEQELKILDSTRSTRLTFPEWANLFAETDGKNLRNDDFKLTSHSVHQPKLAQQLLNVMGTPAHQHGFIEREGLLLCHTTAKFLGEFEVAVIDSANAVKAQQFVEEYLPLDGVTHLAFPDGFGSLKKNGLHPISYRTGSGVRPRSSDNRKDFMDLIADPELGSQVLSLMSPNQWRHLAGQQTLVSSSMLALHKGLNFDNEGLAVRLDRRGLTALHEAGFRFSKQSQVMMSKNQPEETWVDVRLITVDLKDAKDMVKQRAPLDLAFEQMASMGLWPTSTLPAPTDLRSALASCVKRKDVAGKYDEVSISLRSYVRSAGIEACAEEAKDSNKHWSFLLQIFGVDELRPYTPKMPLNARGQVFGQDLGL
ncbi:hypothetical protein [Pseudomonas serbica]|uniref:hypothetical protein n=1 Tax=Pseudomonas serbica TaxID=2965074 RepID=UPI00237B0E47|nr:hypothetical protein [Pseudomonas serbica]